MYIEQALFLEFCEDPAYCLYFHAKIAAYFFTFHTEYQVKARVAADMESLG